MTDSEYDRMVDEERLATISRLEADLEAAHFVRDKIEHAKCQAALVAARREVARVTRLVEKAFWNGVREGGRMVENGEIDVSDVAWLAFQQREGLAPKEDK